MKPQRLGGSTVEMSARGALLLYHGNFDWAGIHIGNFVTRELGATQMPAAATGSHFQSFREPLTARTYSRGITRTTAADGSLLYWNPSVMNGAIPISNMGCALRCWLIVNGACRGQVWADYRADYRGLEPMIDATGARHTFETWYVSWLEAALKEFEVA